MRSARAFKLFEDCVKFKEEAIKAFKRKFPHLKIADEDVEVAMITFSQARSKNDIEECEIFLSLSLRIFIENVQPTDFDKLLRHGKILISSLSRSANYSYSILYKTIYAYEENEEKGAIASFG